MEQNIPLMKTNSDGALCLNASHIAHMNTLNDVPTFTAEVEIYGEKKERVLSEVKIRSRNTPVWADCKTGTLFDKDTGQCLTSQNMRICGTPVRTARKIKIRTKRNKEMDV